MCDACREMGIKQTKILRLELKMQKVIGADPKIDPCLGIQKAVGCDTCVFERLPRDLEEKPLLRVNTLRLTGRNTEHARVEHINVSNKTSLPGDRFSGSIDIAVIHRIGIPSVWRHGTNAIDTISKYTP